MHRLGEGLGCRGSIWRERQAGAIGIVGVMLLVGVCGIACDRLGGVAGLLIGPKAVALMDGR